MSRHSLVLLIDDDREIQELMRLKLGAAGLELRGALDPESALRQLEAPVGLALLDIRLPRDREGLELLRRIRELHPELPVMIFSSRGEVETVVEALHSGAVDYFHKPDLGDPRRFGHLLERIFEELERSAGREPSATRQPWPGFEEIVGSSPATREMISLARLVAPEEIPVLLTGATGTGKEVLARAIHLGGPRAAGPFVPVNCAAIPEPLAESELFGHVRGAFTGAIADRQGKFELADRGTIFLDEVGEMPLSLQAKLLRVLEEKRVTPVGAARAVEVDCRAISATNRNLEEAVGRKEFREDLYYRLAGFPIRLPSLKERGADLAELFAYFARKHNHGQLPRMAPGLLERLARVTLRGNIRQLEQMVRYALIVARGQILAPAHFPQLAGAGLAPGVRTILQAEKQAIEAAMEATGGNRVQAARLLGISRPTLIKKLRGLGTESPERP